MVGAGLVVGSWWLVLQWRVLCCLPVKCCRCRCQRLLLRPAAAPACRNWPCWPGLHRGASPCQRHGAVADQGGGMPPRLPHPPCLLPPPSTQLPLVFSPPLHAILSPFASPPAPQPPVASCPLTHGCPSFLPPITFPAASPPPWPSPQRTLPTPPSCRQPPSSRRRCDWCLPVPCLLS